MESKTAHSKKISLIVFSVTATIVLLSLVPVVFPAFLLVTLGGFENFANINKFESGEWALPVFVVNGITFATLFLYLKKKFPDKIVSAIRFIFRFEVSQKVAFLVIVGLLGLYTGFTIHEIFEK